MASLMVVHLTGEERGKTFIFDQEAITLGIDQSCDLSLDIPVAHNGNQSASRHIIAEIYRQKNNFDLFFRDPENYSLLINREPKTEEHLQKPIPLSDGDLLSVQAVTTTELRMPTELLLHVVQEMDETNPGVRNTRLQFPEVDRGGRIHPRTASRFAKELVIALYAEIPSWARVIAVILTIVIPLGILISTGLVFYGLIRYREILATFSRLSSAAEVQIDEQWKRIKQLEDANKRLQQAFNFAPQIAQTYSSGVSLIQGTYIYKNRQTNQPLRYLDRSFNQGAAIGPDGSLNVSFEGTGDIYYEEFTGTGFVVGDGILLTNRHIAEPWWGDPNDLVIINSLGGKPEIREMFAYFPGFKTRFNLKDTRVSPESDVAVCRFDADEIAIPQLPLDESLESKDSTGQTIVLLGYPTGVDGLIEQLPDEKMKEDLRRRVSVTERTAELAKRGYIRPKVSQGHVTLFIPGQIVHDAPTTDGGSGSPIFSSDGKVIGINARIMVDDKGPVPGSNLGVPIRAALTLLKASKSEEQ